LVAYKRRLGTKTAGAIFTPPQKKRGGKAKRKNGDEKNFVGEGL